MEKAVHTRFWQQKPHQRVCCRVWLLLLPLYLLFLPSRAQTCSAATAESVLTESFGNTPGLALPEGRTTYRLVANGCPNSGEYALVNRLNEACFGVWQTLARDHTPGNGGGTLLLVNGAEQPGEFYRQELPELCGGVDYEFSVWGLNLLRLGKCENSLVPNLSMVIETSSGEVIRRLDIGTLPETPTPVWQRYSAAFTAPATSTETVVVKLFSNQGLAGCGNDFALDDIQLLRCRDCPMPPVYIPTAFSPNNDGVNDQLAVLIKEAVAVSFMVYDRWGNVLFSSTDPHPRWDGTTAGATCAPGPYAWTLTYRFDQSSSKSSALRRSGQVWLIR